MDFNLECNNFKNAIIATINDSKLPAAAIYYILKDIYNSIELQYIEAINYSLSKEQKTENNDEEKDIQ